MKILRKLGATLLTAMLLAAILFGITSAPALADGPDDVVIFGDNYTLEEDEEIEGELFVYGGNVTLKEGSEVKGNVHVFGGNLEVYGEIDGDVTVWGGNVTLHSDAVIRGDLRVIGGNVNRKEGSDVRGSVIEGMPSIPSIPEIPSVPEVPRVPKVPRVPNIPEPRIVYKYRDGGFLSGVGDFFRTIFGILIITVLGILVVVFIPRHTDTVAEAMVKAPVQSLGSGVIAFIAIPIAAVVLAITVCLSPVSVVLLLVSGVGLLFGWIAAGLLFGTKLLRALSKKEPNSVAAVAIGLPVLSVLGMIPCVGWLISLVLWVWSFGAVVYSLFGTRAYNEPMPKFSITKKPADYDPRMDKL